MIPSTSIKKQIIYATLYSGVCSVSSVKYMAAPQISTTKYLNISKKIVNYAVVVER